MAYVYLASNGDVLSVGTTDVALETVQIKNPSAVEKISGAPKGIRPKNSKVFFEYYHQKISGDGTDISHYAEIARTDDIAVMGQRPRDTIRIVQLARPHTQRKHHHDINYKTELTVKLQADYTFANQGELVSTTWYTTYDGANFSDPVLRVDSSYTRDEEGLVIFRTTTRTWFYADGTEHPEKKLTTKWYAKNSQKLKEVRTRRQNNVNVIQEAVMYFIVESGSAATPAEAIVLGRTFMGSLDQEISRYVRTGNDSLRTAVFDATDTWLDAAPPTLGGVATIRDYMLGELI